MPEDWNQSFEPPQTPPTEGLTPQASPDPTPTGPAEQQFAAGQQYGQQWTPPGQYGESSYPAQPYEQPGATPVAPPEQSYPQAQPYPGQPSPEQPYAGQPSPEQPSLGQPYPEQSYSGQPYPTPFPEQPYPAQPYPAQPYGQPGADPMMTSAQPSYPQGQSYSQGQPYPAGQGQPYPAGPYQPQGPVPSAPDYGPSYPPVAPPQQYSYPPQQNWAPQAPVVAEKGSKTGVIVGVVIAVVVLALVGVGIWRLASGPDNPAPAVPTGTSTKAPNPIYTPSSNTHEGGQPAHGTATVDVDYYGPVDYTVTGGAQFLDEVGGFIDADPGMVFVVVPVTITYQGTESVYIVNIDDTALVTTDGAQHTPDSTGELVSEMPDGSTNPLWLATLGPGESVDGLLVYQIDTDLTAGAVLMVGVTTSAPATLSVGL